MPGAYFVKQVGQHCVAGQPPDDHPCQAKFVKRESQVGREQLSS